MTWNFRIVNKNGMLGIHEAFYDCDATTGILPEPNSITEDTVDVTGADPDELADLYKQMAEAFLQPILEFNEIGK